MGVLDGKRVIVTGGSMGIGLAVAKNCAEAGALLILISRHESDLRQAVERLGCSGGDHIYRQLDVSILESVRDLADELGCKFGHIDGLVNCAGVYGPIGKIDEVDPA